MAEEKLSIWGNPLKPEGYGKMAKRKAKGKAKAAKKKAKATKAKAVAKGKTYRGRNQYLRQMGFASYKAYLASALWASIRRKVLDRDKGICTACELREAREVHHLQYDLDTLNGVTLTHLVSLCHACHHKCEFRRDGRKRNPRQARDSAIARTQARDRVHAELESELDRKLASDKT